MSKSFTHIATKATLPADSKEFFSIPAAEVSGIETEKRFFTQNSKLWVHFFSPKNRKWRIREARQSEYQAYAEQYLNQRFGEEDFTIKGKDFPRFRAGHTLSDYDYQERYGIEIIYTDFRGNLYAYENAYRGKRIKQHLSRVRLAPGLEKVSKDSKGNPKTNSEGKPIVAKYLQPRGVETLPYFTSLYHYFHETHRYNGKYHNKGLHKIEYVVLVEGEFKAEALCRMGIPAIGLAGIHNMGQKKLGCMISKKNAHQAKNPTTKYYCGFPKGHRRKKSEKEAIPSNIRTYVEEAYQVDRDLSRRGKNKFVDQAQTIGYEFHPELKRFFEACTNLKGVILMHDSDALDGSLKRRVGSFYTAVRNFQYAASEYNFEAYYTHLNPILKNTAKGIDDLIETMTKEQEGRLLSSLGVGARDRKPLPKPEFRASMDYEKRLHEVKEEVLEVSRQLQEAINENSSFLRISRLQLRQAQLYQEGNKLRKSKAADKSRYNNKLRVWEQQKEEGRVFVEKPFRSTCYLAFYDLRSLTQSELRSYFAEGEQNPIAVRCNRSQVASAPRKPLKSRLKPLNKDNRNIAVGLDWFQVAIKSEVFVSLDPSQSYRKSLEDDQFPEEIQLNDGFKLIWKGTHAGSWKYFYNVTHNGVQFGSLKGGEMGMIGTTQPDFCHFQANNEQLYLRGFVQRFKRFLQAVGGTFNNFSRLDICLDMPVSAFKPVADAPLYKAYKSPVDFFNDVEKGIYQKLGKAGTAFRKNGHFEKEGVKVNGVGVGSMDSPRMVSIYNKSNYLLQEHKPYISEWHDKNGLADSGEIWRFEFRFNREEMEKYKHCLNLDSLSSTKVLIDIVRKSTLGWFEFVPADHPNKQKRKRPRVPLFDWEDIKEVQYLSRKTKQAQKDKQRATLIGMKKLIRSYMLTGEQSYLQIYCREQMRTGLGGDKLKYWFEDIQYEKEREGKYDDLCPVTFSQFYKELHQAMKKWDKGLEPQITEYARERLNLETIGRPTLDEDYVELLLRDWAVGESEIYERPMGILKTPF